MASQSRKPILIAGAGLASLLLARSLLRSSIPFLLFERDASLSFRAQGYRLRLSALGLDAIEEVLGPEGFPKFWDRCGKTGGTRGFAVLNALTGEEIAAEEKGPSQAPQPTERLRSRDGKTIGISRGGMRALFMEGCEPYVRFSHQVTGYELTENGVRAIFKDGSKSEEGEMLVAGDGIYSKVAKQVSGGRLKTYDTGARGIHGQAPTTAFKDLGEGVWQIRDDSKPDGKRTWVITNVRPDDMDDPSIEFGWTMGAPPGVIKPPNDDFAIIGKPAADIARSLAADWNPRFKPLFDNMNESESAFWKITCSTPSGVPEWPNQPRVTVIGDAVHSMTPAGGIGANTAVRDSALLGRLLAEAGGYKDSVTAAYEKEMRVYGSEAVKTSYGSASEQFGIKIDEETTPTVGASFFTELFVTLFAGSGAFKKQRPELVGAAPPWGALSQGRAGISHGLTPPVHQSASMSGRKIGGGRVLGRAPPAQQQQSASPSPSPFPKRHSSLLAPSTLSPPGHSPSTSSVSLDSSASTSHTSTDTHTQDEYLGSRVSLGHASATSAAVAAEAAAASARMICPICSEEMANDAIAAEPRHLDDNHKNLEDVEQNEVKDWFEKQVKKAKKFQPLAVLNQKLRGFDVFESNDELAAAHASGPSSNAGTPTKSPEPPAIDPDEVVIRTHWQRPGPNDMCAEPSCGRRLNATNGKVNCRKCGKLFCEVHTMYQIKLSRSANHEPVRGYWCRVCETCYKSREGYNDHVGAQVDHTKDFEVMRRKHVDQKYLEISRLEKRLTKLTSLLANPPEQNTSTGGMLWPMTSMKNARKELEQSVVTWEDDNNIQRCPFCQQEFSSYTFRRHHCRTCGRVVCGDPGTDCSNEVALNVAAQGNLHEKQGSEVAVDVRMCRDCKHTIFGKRDFQAEAARKPPDLRAYENLTQMERGIRTMLPKFQRLLVALQDPDRPPTQVQLAEASRTRKRLMEAFTQYDGAGRRIRDMPSASETQKKLQKQVYQQVTNFLHTHMLPLQSLPKILKHATPNGALSPGQRTPNGKPHGALATIKLNSMEASSQVSGSSAISALEEEEKVLRDRLIVLEEQKFFVSEMIADANKRRKFDEVSALAQNVQDLSTEIDQIQGQIANLDFAAVYTGSGTSTPVGR